MDVLRRHGDELGVRSVHVLAEDAGAVVQAGVENDTVSLGERVDPSPSAATTPAPSAPRIRGFGTEGSPCRIQRSRWLSEAARRRTSTSPGPGVGSSTSS